MKTKSNPFLRFTLLAATAALATLASAHAATYTWIGGTSSDFTEPANWDGGAWTQWSDYTFGGTPTRASINLNLSNGNEYGMSSLTLQSGLTQDIVISSAAGSRLIMGTDQSSSSGLITIAEGSSNLTINAEYIASTAVTWDVGAGRTLTMAGQLNNWYNPASLVKSGSGTAVLTANNSYGGGTTISSGTLQIGNGGATGTLGSGAVTIASGAVLTINRSGTYGTTSDQSFSGAGILVKEGTGDMIFNGTFDANNSVANLQNLTVNGGLVRTDNFGAWKSDLNLTANGSGKFELWNTNTALGTLNGNGTVQNTVYYGRPNTTITVAAGSFSGTITDSGGDTRLSLVKSGSGTLTLSGANSYNGLTDITEGTLVAANNTALGASSWSADNMTRVRDGATLVLQGGVSLADHMHLTGTGVGGLGALRSISGSNALTMTYNNSGSGPGFALDGNTTIGVDADTLTVTGFYHDSGSYGITKVGNGTLVLSQTSSYTGGTTINEGTIVATRNTLGTGAVEINNGGTLYANDQWVLCGVNQHGVVEQNIGTLTINAGGTLQLDATNGYANGATNLFLNGGLVTGGPNDRRGDLYLYIGYEQITAGATGGATTSTIDSVIGLTGNNNTITVVDASTLNITKGMKNSDWYDGSGLTGGFIKSGSGTLVLAAANTYTGLTTVSNGTLKVTGNNYLPGNGGITVGTGATLMTDAANDANTQRITSTITLNGGTMASGTGIAANNTHGLYGNYFLDNGASIQAGGNATSTISASLGLGTGLPTAINVDGGSTLNISGDIFGVSYVVWGQFSKSGDGTLVLSGNNKSTLQGMILSGGTVEFSTNSLPTNARVSIPGAPAGYSADIQGNATLRWATGNTQDISFENGAAQIKIGDGVTATFDTNGNNVTLATAFDLGDSQTGALTKSGSGTLTLTGANSYTGTTTVAGGTLALQGGGGGGSNYNGSNININGASTLRVSGERYNFAGETFTFDSVGGGTLDAIASGAGGMVFMGGNTFATSGGAQNIISGTRNGSENQGFNLNGETATFNVATGTDSTSDLKVIGTIWNGGNVIKTGTGRLEFFAAQQYTGNTTVNEGTLNLNNAMASGTLSVLASAVMNVNSVAATGSSTAVSVGGVANFSGTSGEIYTVGSLDILATGTATLTAHSGGAGSVKVLDISSLIINGTTAFAGGADKGGNFSGFGGSPYSPAPVPEPGTIGLIGLGIFAMTALRRRPSK